MLPKAITSALLTPITRTRHALAADLEKRYNIKAYVFGADLSKEDAAASLAKAADEKLGHVDVLVNNAGVASDSRISQISMKDWERTFRVNLFSQFLLAQKLGPERVKRGYGRIDRERLLF